MADALSEVLIDLGLKTDGIRQSIREIEYLFAKMNKDEEARAARGEKQTQEELLAQRDMIKLQKLFLEDKERFVKILQQDLELYTKRAGLTEQELSNQRQITTEMAKQLNLSLNAANEPSKTLPHAEPRRYFGQNGPTQGSSGGGGGLPPRYFGVGGGPSDGGGGGQGGGVWGLLTGGFNILSGALATLSGNLMTKALDTITDKIKGIGQAAIEAAHQAGPLLNVFQSFENVSASAGINAGQFAEQLGDATEGMVDDVQLMSLATTMLRQNMGITQEQFVELTNVTQRFARATGKDPIEAINLLNQAMTTGRLSMLAFRLGLDPATKDLLGMTENLDRATRAQTQLAIVTYEMKRQLQLTGEPVYSISERLRQLYEWLDTTQKAIIRWIFASSEVNGVLAILHESVRLLWTTLSSLVEIINSLVITFTGGLFGATKESTESVGFMAKSFVRLAQVITILDTGVKNLAATFAFLADVMAAVWSEDTWAQATERFQKRIDEQTEAMYARIAELEDQITPNKGRLPGQEKLDPLGVDRQKQETQKLLIDTEKAMADRSVAIAKDAAAEKKLINDALFKHNLISLEQYTNRQKEIAKEERDAALTAAKATRDAALRKLNIEAFGSEENARRVAAGARTLGKGGTIPQVIDDKRLAAQRLQIQLDYLNQVTAAERQKRNADFAAEEAKFADQKKANEQLALADIANQKAILAYERDLLGVRYEFGQISERQLLDDARTLELRKKALDIAEADEKLKQAGGELASAQAREAHRAAITAILRDDEKNELTYNTKVAAGVRRQEEQLVQERLAVRRNALAELAQITALEYQQGQINTERFIQLEVDRFMEEDRLAKEMLDLRWKNNAQSFQNEADYLNQIAQINEDTNAKIASLERQRSQMQEQEIRKRLQIELEYATSDAVSDARQKSNDEIQKEIDLLDATIARYYTLRKAFDPLSQEYKRLSNEIAKLEGQQEKLNAEMATTTKALAGMFSGVGGLFGVGGGREIGAALGQGGNILQSLIAYAGPQGAGRNFTGLASTNFIAGLGTSFKSLFEKKFDEAGNPVKDFGEKLGKLNGVLNTAFTTIGGMIQVFRTQSVGAGIVGGGLAFGSFGMGVGQLIQGLGGPAGALIGGAVGAIVGGFTAAAKKRTAEMAKDFAEVFQEIVDALNKGTVGLGQTIDQLNETRQKTVQSLSGRKGGREQLDALLPQMDQQIAALQARQKSLVESLVKDLHVLTAPEELGSTINTLDQIIEKFEEYGGAIGTISNAQSELFDAQSSLRQAKENFLKDPEKIEAAQKRVTAAEEQLTIAKENHGKAQEFLNAAVARYIETQERELTRAEEDAIERAIEYNDLIERRAEIIKNAAEREYDIRFAGVLKRQRTLAQTKMSQIEEVRKERDEQLEQIDKQMKLIKFQMDAEKQMFDIATTRIDLEARLEALKQHNIIMDLQRLVALHGVIASLKSVGSSVDIKTLTDALNKNFGFSKSAEQMYSDYSRMGYAGFTGEL